MTARDEQETTITWMRDDDREALIDAVRDRPTITRMSHGAQIEKIEQLRDALRRRTVQGEPTDDEREALAQVGAELGEWLRGERSWCDQHHGKPDEIELTARADEATIRLLATRRDVLRRTVQSEPTDAMVEAAALAINEAGWTYEGEHNPGCLAEGCDECHSACAPVARAALHAALAVSEQGHSDA